MTITATNAALALTIVALACAGCADSQGTKPTALPAGPSYDGVYRGHSLPVAGTDGGCGAGGPVTLLVMGNKFFFRWTPQVNLEVHVDPDGALHGMPYGTAAPVSMEGRITAGQFRASVGGGQCRFNLELNRS